MAVTVGTGLLKIVPDLTGLAAQLQGGIGKPLRQIGSSLTSAGKALTVGMTLPIIGLGAAAVKAAVDWESAFAGVRKTLDATPDELAAIEQGLRDMSKQIPTTAVELASIAEAAGALGIATEDVLEFTRVIAGLSEATNLTADEAATAFGQLGNVLKLSGEDFSRLGSTIVDLGNKGASTESEITELMLRLAGTGATVGLATDEIAGLAAAMANAGINAEAGGTAMSTTIQRMAKAAEQGGEDLAGFAKVAGMSAEEFAIAFRDKPAEAFAAFVDGLSQMQEGGEGVFTMLDELGIKGKREQDTLLRIGAAAMTVAETLGIAESAWRENSALAEETEERYKTVRAQLDIFKETIKDALITLGEGLLPVLQDVLNALKPVIEFVARLAEGFTNLPGTVKGIILAIAGIAAVIGPVLMIFGALVTAIGAIAPLVGVAALIVLGVAAAIAGAAALVIANWDRVKQFFATIWQAIAPTVQGIVDQFKSVGSALLETWAAVGPVVMPMLQAIAGAFIAFGAAVIGVVRPVFGAIVQIIGAAVKVVANVIKLVLALIRGDWSAAWNAIKGIASGVWAAIRAVISGAIGAIKAIVTGGINVLKAVLAAGWAVIRAAVTVAWNVIRAVLTGAWNGLKAVVTGGINAIKSVLSAGWSAISSGARAAWDAVVGAFRRAWSTIAGIVSKIKETFCNLPFVPCSPIPLVEDAKLAVAGMERELGKLRTIVPRITSGIDVPVLATATAASARAGRAGGASSIGTPADVDRIVAAIAHQEDSTIRALYDALRVELDGRELARSAGRHNAFRDRGIG